MADYKTPGVYVEEISTLPPSVGQVPTAIPAFVGYTSKAERNGKSLKNSPTHITSMLDYQQMFGGKADLGKISVKLDKSNRVEEVTLQNKRYLYDSVRLFFANGGGECYIVSVGSYDDKVTSDDLLSGVSQVAKEDHPTILLCPDAMLLEKKEQAYSVQQAMLSQCTKLQDRVAVLDVFDGYKERADEDVVLNFRNGIGVNSLKYGAAYYPWVQSTFTPSFGFEAITLINSSGKEISFSSLMSDATVIEQIESAISDYNKLSAFVLNPFSEEGSLKDIFFDAGSAESGSLDEANHYVNVLAQSLKNVVALKSSDYKNPLVVNELTVKTNANSPVKSLCEALLSIGLATGSKDVSADDFAEYDLSNATAAFSDLEGEELASSAISSLKSMFDQFAGILVNLKQDVFSIKEGLDSAVYSNSPVYKNVVNEIQKQSTLIPPSGAIAGLYAFVDADRGVWKAPANVSMSSVAGPWIKLDNQQQEDLNVDVLAGKSINAIRPFTGKGTLVWGARTLAGNDNEWRYIPVRRLFNMVESSIRLSTNWAVFEPNDQNTWIRVKAMIENYLTNLWSQGALAGSSPSAAFFVNVGLGSTMSQVDILEGRMNIEIGMAAVRPAEFIVLKFSHKLQES